MAGNMSRENQVDSNDFARKNFGHSGFCDFVEPDFKAVEVFDECFN